MHEKCYVKYIHQHNVASARKRTPSTAFEGEPSSTCPRLDEESFHDEFDWANKCFLCDIPIRKTKSLRRQYRMVTSRFYADSIKEAILHPNCNYDESKKDAIIKRMSSVRNFEKTGAIYHTHCYVQLFSYEKSVKTNVSDKINDSVFQIIEFIDNHEHTQFTLKELTDMLPNDDYKPSDRSILRSLKEHYGDDLVVVGNRNASTLICVSSKGLYSSLNDSWNKNQIGADDDNDEKLLSKAAAILTKEIRENTPDFKDYPKADTMLDDLYEKIPPKLKFFLDYLIFNTHRKKQKHDKYQEKIASAAHVLMSAVCPRYYLSPLLLSLRVLLHREFGTRNVIDTFNACCLTASYAEVKKYEMSAAKHTKITLKPGTFVQYVWDNCDNNYKSLLGGEFHCAGEIAIVTPASGVEAVPPIPRNVKISAQDTFQWIGKDCNTR